MQKVLILLAVLLLPLNLVLVGCGAIFPTPEPVNLTFVLQEVDRSYYESLLPEFYETHPNITITFQPLQDNLPSNADVVLFPWFATQDSTPSDLGLLPIDEFISQEKDFAPEYFFPGALDVFVQEGKQYALPIGADPWVMFYNKDLFDSMGVPYPQSGWSWNDFLATSQALRDVDAKTYGYTPATTDYIDAMMFVFQHGGILVDNNGRPTFDDPLNIEAIEWYVDLFKEYNVAPTESQARADFGSTEYAAMRGVMTGKIGMFMSQLSARGGRYNFPVEWNFNWGLVELPRDQSAFTISFFDGGAVSATSAHPDEAWAWLAFISRKPHNRLIPARVSLAESDAFIQLVGEDVARVGRTAVGTAMFVDGQVVNDLGGIIDIFLSTIDSVVNEDRNVAEAMLEAQFAAEQR